MFIVNFLGNQKMIIFKEGKAMKEIRFVIPLDIWGSLSSNRIRPIHLSKKNHFPCMWEKGGLKSKEEGGSATIICSEKGANKKPIFVNWKKNCSCGEHALIVVQKDDIVIDVVYQGNEMDIWVRQIDGIHTSYCEASVHCIARFSHCFSEKENIKEAILDFKTFDWIRGEVAEKYQEAILAAFNKVTHYHCRGAHFCKGVTE